MNDRRTNLLFLLLLVAAVMTLYARAHLREMRGSALVSERDLAECRGYLVEVRATGANASPAAHVTDEDSAAGINQCLREAAAAAGAGEKLTSIEPGNTETVGQSTESSVFLHLEPLTMRELVTFLHQLAASRMGAHAKSIELEAPAGETQGNTWVADVSIGYFAGSSGSRDGEPVEVQ